MSIRSREVSELIDAMKAWCFGMEEVGNCYRKQEAMEAADRIDQLLLGFDQLLLDKDAQIAELEKERDEARRAYCTLEAHWNWEEPSTIANREWGPEVAARLYSEEVHCPTCGGGGGDGWAMCPDCGGSGKIPEEKP